MTNSSVSTAAGKASLRSHGRVWTGKRVLGWILGFFLVIIGVNMGLLYYALTSWPGLAS